MKEKNQFTGLQALEEEATSQLRFGQSSALAGSDEEGTKKQSALRRYAQIVSVGLLLLGGACMLGVGTTNPLIDLDHLFVGGLLAYAGFRFRDEKFVRTIVGGTGVIYLLAGLLAFVVPALFGMFPETPNGIFLNHLVHLVVGISNIAAVAFLRQGLPVKRSRRRERYAYLPHETASDAVSEQD